MSKLTPHEIYELTRREPEPICNCQECPNRFGDCAEYNALNRPNYPYNRGSCHWGSESIKKENEIK